MRSIGRRSFMKICGATALAATVPFKVRQVAAKPSEPPTNEEGWTAEKIAEATLTWCNYPGWTAWSCGKCHATMNVLCGAGFFCPRCEHYNILPWSGHIIPDEHPNFGPKLATIRRGHELAERMVEAKRKFKPGDHAASTTDHHFQPRSQPAVGITSTDLPFCG